MKNGEGGSGESLGGAQRVDRSLFGWKHPRAQVFEEKSLKNEEIEEEGKGPLLRFVYPLLPPLFSFLFIVVFSLEMF